MSCDVIDYRIQSNLAIPLKPGELRIVDKFMVSFLDSDTYSKSSTSECIGKKDEKVCMSKGNDVYCSNPKPKFMVKSLKKDNSKIVVQNRCDGGYRKYSFSDSYLADNVDYYIEDRMYFKIKNQIHNTFDSSSYNKPVIVFSKMDNDSISLSIESFSKEHITSNTENSEVLGLSPSKSDLEIGLHEKISLNTSCKLQL